MLSKKGTNHWEWRYEAVSATLEYGCRVIKIVHSRQSQFQTIEIIDTEAFGRILVLDGKIQSAEIDEFIYHESLVHPALITHLSPKSVFIAGGGEGATAREVLRHSSVERLLMVDLDPEVIQVSQKFLPDQHQGAFSDPRLELKFGDAHGFLRNSSETFDVFILDLCDPTLDGPASELYTLSFYQTIFEKLNPGGAVVTQMGPAGIINYLELFTAVFNTMKQVFPVVVPYVASVQSFGEPWGFGFASRSASPSDLSREQVDSRLLDRSIRNLRCYDGETHIGLFSLPAYLRKALTVETRVNVKGSPLVIF